MPCHRLRVSSSLLSGLKTYRIPPEDVDVKGRAANGKAQRSDKFGTAGSLAKMQIRHAEIEKLSFFKQLDHLVRFLGRPSNALRPHIQDAAQLDPCFSIPSSYKIHASMWLHPDIVYLSCIKSCSMLAKRSQLIKQADSSIPQLTLYSPYVELLRHICQCQCYMTFYCICSRIGFG